MALQYAPPGQGDVGSYLLSGIPWVTGSTAVSGEVVHFSFPGVTKFFVVRNTGTGIVNVGFSQNGLTMAQNHHRFSLSAGQEQKLDIRITDIYLSASTGNPTYEIIAGLTPIPYDNFLVLTGSVTSSIFSGIG